MTDKESKSGRRPSTIPRRRIIAASAILAAAAVARPLPAASEVPAPIESGLSHEGLLAGEAGFQPRRPAPLSPTSITGFLSARQLEINYRVYRQAFADLLATESALRALPRPVASAEGYRELRARQLVSGNSVLMHEFYFRNLAPAKVKPSAYILGNMTEHMASLESWMEDFIACARAASSWAALVYDPYDDRWHNVALGDHDAGGWIGSNPLVVCDVAEHAYSSDQNDREVYVRRFIEHIDWNVVGARYRAVDRH